MLYHGTRVLEFADIREKGIEPRGEKESNWQEYPSHPDLVYLTTAYACYFAYCSLKEADLENVLLILEVDESKLDEWNMRPDEDWVARRFSSNTLASMRDKQNAALANIDLYAGYWRDCLDELGNCSHRGVIPVSALTRWATFDASRRTELSMTILDPTITEMNYKILGSFYRGLIAWIFGDEKELPHLKKDNVQGAAICTSSKIRDFWAEQSEDRSGIVVGVV